MKKIISLFKRDYEGTRKVYNEVTPGAEWVANGEGTATRKFDGTCCLIREGILYKRYEVKKGKTPPLGFEPACDVDRITGKQQGWIRVDESNPSDKWHIQAFQGDEVDGTYELCGPKVQGNPEVVSRHILIKHGQCELSFAPRTYEEIKEYLRSLEIEGIVWHHEDGRMVKIKKKDFNYNENNN